MIQTYGFVLWYNFPKITYPKIALEIACLILEFQSLLNFLSLIFKGYYMTSMRDYTALKSQHINY